MSRDQNCLPDNLIDLYADYFIDSSRNHDIDTVYDIVSEMHNNHLDQGDEFME